MSDKLNKASREIQGYKEILSTVWDEDLTDEEELIYLKFYRAGIKIAETNNLKHETVEQLEEAITPEERNYGNLAVRSDYPVWSATETYDSGSIVKHGGRLKKAVGINNEPIDFEPPRACWRTLND